MTKIRVGINGFGRIGRNFLRAQIERGGDFEIVAANDIGDTKTMAHLLKHDSVLGPLERAGRGRRRVHPRRRPGDQVHWPRATRPQLPWGELGVDVVIESTGHFTKRDGAAEAPRGRREEGRHLGACDRPGPHPRARRQRREYDPEKHNIISNASCTTNCIAPIAKILHDAFTIERGFMTTIHAYTNDQKILDFPHKDLRRARAAAINLIPTSTGAARAIGVVIPELKGKVDGMSMRAPVPTGSIVDLVVQVSKETSVEAVNELFRSKAERATSRASSSTRTSRSCPPTSSTRRTRRSSTAA